MATVYRARQEGMDRTVALKVLEESFLDNEKITQRLMTEARIAARFNHPHIVRALDAGVHGRTCYFVMELVDGQSVRDLLETQGPLSEVLAVDLAIEVAEALFQLHSEHIVHRDVKPANILLDQEGNALLADLGLAKIQVGSSGNSQDHAVGTPAYMSPEQAKEPDSVDVRTDLFSLGATLYHAVTGISPFDGPSVGAAITKVLYHEPAEIRELNPEISDSFSDVVTKLLCKKRDDRYSSPRELLRDLRAIRRGAAPRHAQANSKKWSNQKIAGVATFFLAVVLAAYFSLPGSKDEDTSKRETRAAKKLNLNDKTFAEDNVQSVIQRSLLSVRTKIAVGQLAAAQDDLKVVAPTRLAQELGISLAKIPSWVRIRFENEGRKLEQQITALRKKSGDAAMTTALSLYTETARRRAAMGTFLSKSEFSELLAKNPIPNANRFDEKTLELARKRVAEEIRGEWRIEFNESIERLRFLLSENNFDQARRTIKTLMDRKPGALGSGFLSRVKSIEDRFSSSRVELTRQVENLLATVDILPPRGSPELRKREFAPLISRFATMKVILGGAFADDDPHWRDFFMVRKILLRSRAWLRQASASLEAKELNPELILTLLDGEEVSGFAVEWVKKGVASLKMLNGGKQRQIHVQELSVSTLKSLQKRKLDSLDSQVEAWFHYCDGELVAAEVSLGSLAEATQFALFMAPRLERAWKTLAHVATPRGKEAFRLWRHAMAEYGAGNWDVVLAAAKNILDSKELKETTWYQANRESIQLIAEKAQMRSRISVALKGLKGQVDVFDLEPISIGLVWSFDDKSEGEDFRLPRDVSWESGVLRREALMAPLPVRPDRVEPIVFRLPMSLSQVPFEVTINYRTSVREEDAPRCLVFSAFGINVALLSRLRTHRLMHLQLHGVEKSLLEFAEYGRAAIWRGGADGFGAAFAESGLSTDFLFKTNTRYSLRFRFDGPDKKLSVFVDDRLILQREMSFDQTTGDSFSLRIPMPHVIERIQMSCGLALGE